MMQKYLSAKSRANCCSSLHSTKGVYSLQPAECLVRFLGYRSWISMLYNAEFVCTQLGFF